MKKKQVYKTLTKTQAKKVSLLAKKGVSQRKIAKKLGIAKQSVATFLRVKGIGKRVKNPFWEDVKSIQRLHNLNWKEAREKTFYIPYWTKKRAARKGKEYKTFNEFWEEQKKEYKNNAEKQEALAEEMEEFEFASA